jgi:hypothetical protein
MIKRKDDAKLKRLGCKRNIVPEPAVPGLYEWEIVI